MEKLTWGGVFAVAKHISSVDPIELDEMSEADWDILDFPELRPAARQRLVSMIERGRLECFFRVNYDMHKRSHGGKPTYFYPATEANRDAFENGEYGESNFENFDNYEEEPDAEFPSFERRRTTLEDLGTAAVAPAVYAAYRILKEEQPEQEQRVERVQTSNQRDFYRLQPWAVSILLLSLVRRMTTAQLIALARELGATEFTEEEEEYLIDLIISRL